MLFRRKPKIDYSQMTQEELQVPINKFKNRTLPIIVSVIGSVAALFFMLWVLGVFSR